MNPGSPYARAVAKERARLTDLLTARTNPDGTPKRGLRTNVAAIRAKLAKLPVEKANEPGI